MKELLTKDKHINPWFTCPGITVDMVVAGVLHCVGLGASAEVIGHIRRGYIQKRWWSKLQE